jgi:hypothetical protein
MIFPADLSQKAIETVRQHAAGAWVDFSLIGGTSHVIFGVGGGLNKVAIRA